MRRWSGSRVRNTDSCVFRRAWAQEPALGGIALKRDDGGHLSATTGRTPLPRSRHLNGRCTLRPAGQPTSAHRPKPPVAKWNDWVRTASVSYLSAGTCSERQLPHGNSFSSAVIRAGMNFRKECSLLPEKASRGLTPYERTKAGRRLLTAISTKQ